MEALTKAGAFDNIFKDRKSIFESIPNLISKSKNPKAFIKELDPNRVRPTDITLQIPDSTKFREKTGWKPTKGLEEICDDLLNYWREVL